jgi:hypothetical protein
MANDSPAAILFDELGNPVGVTFDGYAYRLDTNSLLTDGTNGPVAVKPPFTAAVSADPALVVAISPNNPITTTTARPATNNSTSVMAATSNTVLLAPNGIRLGATVYNDSSALLYLKLGITATFSDFTIKLFPFCYYEVPFGYTGEIDAIWNNANGFARVGEMIP